MKQITEDYVSFETAKLLKEKGFDIRCRSYYHNDDYLSFEHPKGFVSVDDVYLLRPTHKMALKWLREVHKCYTHICPFYPDMKYNEPPKWLAAVDYNSEGYPTLPKHFDSYEEACESALLYVLKNLI